ncbi:sulfotransferase family 2 domain-containing protein [Aromatoleum diolicum]|uniref:Sulfotransferase family protein n=1 Tax=Aromatoleum diolicum TaxID=75796 RepID=A0ABX1QC88_9RHOO|nr:sulfotransferase family 2 domain-containing protein [Aromatoleum diolicum]NMG76009.1 hypothetical protein [Aromatoleum diolicum]
MPISHDHRVIFVHIPKNGGSSIEKALGIYGVENRGDNRLVDERMLFGKGLQHLTMSEINERIPSEISQTYFKFAFVRNPWARALSEYRWRAQWDSQIAKMSFTKFVFDQLGQPHAYRHYWPQVDFIADRSQPGAASLLVDFVGRLEHLQSDFGEIINRCGLSDIVIPQINRSEAKETVLNRMKKFIDVTRGTPQPGGSDRHRSYRAQYNEETRDLIGRIYCRDIETFGYDF